MKSVYLNYCRFDLSDDEGREEFIVTYDKDGKLIGAPEGEFLISVEFRNIHQFCGNLSIY